MSEFAEFHDELRRVARDLLAGAGDERALCKAAVAAGWLGLEVPEEFGGAGAGSVESAIPLVEIGRAAAPTALSTVLALSVPALLAAEPEPLRDSLLRDVVVGSALPVVVLEAEVEAEAGGVNASPDKERSAADGSVERSEPWNTQPPPNRRLAADGCRVEDRRRSEGSTQGGEPRQLEVRRSGSGFSLALTPDGPHLSGTARFVLDAGAADLLLIPARTDTGETVLTAVHPDLVTLRAVPLVDATRSAASVTADHAPVRAVWQLRTPLDLPARAALAVACDSLGIAEAMLDATVAYVKIREQFGRPVGSFQAVKHACADMLVQTTLTRHLVAAAVEAVNDSAPDSALAVARAKSYATSTAVRVAGKAVQLHGGYGYTWESGLHVHLKRATLNRALYGSPTTHRRTLAAHHTRDGLA
ncbi:acyl-CoA dehydrogenase family protein [Nocardia takedensis]|uniref:acyl-CoA dehydrogenase family protein n=1 Tax=Nocardia takedensis TaxID=259390 RepID=UPI0002FB2E5F|nr:acyl-CoA dehydrogenase family protein [Nocardia takedensis]